MRSLSRHRPTRGRVDQNMPEREFDRKFQGSGDRSQMIGIRRWPSCHPDGMRVFGRMFGIWPVLPGDASRPFFLSWVCDLAGVNQSARPWTRWIMATNNGSWILDIGYRFLEIIIKWQSPGDNNSSGRSHVLCNTSVPKMS